MNQQKGGLKYIANQQGAQGGFAAYRIDGRADSHDTTFVPTLIALALHDVPGSQAIRRRITDFLLRQKTENWAWNYWDKASPHAVERPYPDDLDDTFLALTHLWLQDQSLFTPEVMAKIVSLLFMTETAVGGPYITWIVDKDTDGAWRDVDVIVNGNVAGFLAQRGVSLARVEALIEQAIDRNQLASPYYPGLLPGAYLIARWYRGPKVPDLCGRILRQQADGRGADAHQTALAVSALLRLGYAAEKLAPAVDYIRATQTSDGSWPAGAMYIDDGLYGTPALTTALCLESLALYERASKQTDLASRRQADDPLYQAVMARLRLVIRHIAQPDLRAAARQAIAEIIDHDAGRQIVTLPQIVQSMTGNKVSVSTLQNLAVISAWGWVAYTIFDDFLDGQGNPALLPVAQLAHRHMLAAIQATLPHARAFHDEVDDILGRIDSANAWEVAHCRGGVAKGKLVIDVLPDYGDLQQLADRSLGHSIAGLGILYDSGYNSDSAEMRALREFFRHYLIARQLNDDAHDWLDDLRRGHINFVGGMVVQRWLQARPSRSLAAGIHLTRHAGALQSIMWQQVIDAVCDRIEQHSARARAAIDTVPAFQARGLLALLDPLERGARRARSSRDEARAFIANLQ